MYLGCVAVHSWYVNTSNNLQNQLTVNAAAFKHLGMFSYIHNCKMHLIYIYTWN